MERRFEKLTFITGNVGKAKYLSDYFHFPVEHVKLDLPEIQSLDLRTVVEDKAKKAFSIVKGPVLVEDVSLVFGALEKLPGPLIKWFLEALGNDGLCELLNRYDDRRATAHSAVALCDANGVQIFSGVKEGSVSTEPRGDAGFGWDPIFIPTGYTKTWAEMTDQEKHETSMRRIALEEMKKYLNPQE